MRRSAFAAVIFTCAFAFVEVPHADAADLAARPPEAMRLDATPLTIGELLTRHAAAIGERTPSEFWSEHWRTHEGELDGTYAVQRSGNDYRVDTTSGPLHTASGSSGGVRWRQDENGYTFAVGGIHDLDHVDALPDRGGTLLGRSAALQAYVVELDRDGRDTFFFYDEANALLVRSIKAQGDRWQTTTYDDFFTHDGATEPRHIRTRDGRAYDDRERWLVSESTSAIAPEAVAVADGRKPIVVPGGRARLPARIAGDRIYLTAQIDHRAVTFAVDSGSSKVVLDGGVASALGLTQFGRTTETIAGSFVVRHALIASLDVGPFALDRLFAQAAPSDVTATSDGPIAGLLGGDFLASSVFAIDYEAGTMDAIDTATFAPPANAIALDARFDDGVPTVAAHVGDAISQTFVLDTGADRSMLFHRFIAAHPEETAEQGLGMAELAAFPYASAMRGIGGEVAVQPLQVKSFGIGSVTFAKWMFSVVAPGQLSFQGQDYDGLIGQDVLRFFTVYLDYPHERVYLVPNDRYARRFG